MPFSNRSESIQTAPSTAPGWWRTWTTTHYWRECHGRPERDGPSFEGRCVHALWRLRRLRSGLEVGDRPSRLLRACRAIRTRADQRRNIRGRTPRRGAFMHLHRDGPRRLGLRLSNEATIASIASISREVSTASSSRSGSTSSTRRPGSAADHERHFRCPVLFESDRDAARFLTEILQAPNSLGDESISRFFETHLETGARESRTTSLWTARCCDQVSRSLSEGVPKVSDVAGHLCMSARTLQRRLADGGHSYQSLVDEARRRLSARLLRETGLLPQRYRLHDRFRGPERFHARLQTLGGADAPLVSRPGAILGTRLEIGADCQNHGARCQDPLSRIPYLVASTSNEGGSHDTFEQRKFTDHPILVLGGTGKTGRRVASLLENRGVPVRIGSRSASPPSTGTTSPGGKPA